MNIDLTSIVQSTIMLFIILDPIGNSPLFYAYTEKFDNRKRRMIILQSVALATGMLVFFSFFGEPFFKYFGITLADFRIAGGIILLIYGLWGIFGNTEVEIVKDSESLAIVPLATPLLAGPGSITTVIYIKYNYGSIVSMASIAIDVFLTTVILILGDRLFAIFGKKGSVFLVKLFSMILTAIAIGMIRQGITDIVHNTLYS